METPGYYYCPESFDVCPLPACTFDKKTLEIVYNNPAFISKFGERCKRCIMEVFECPSLKSWTGEQEEIAKFRTNGLIDDSNKIVGKEFDDMIMCVIIPKNLNNGILKDWDNYVSHPLYGTARTIRQVDQMRYKSESLKLALQDFKENAQTSIKKIHELGLMN
jgi:hypothetical protein